MCTRPPNFAEDITSFKILVTMLCSYFPDILKVLNMMIYMMKSNDIMLNNFDVMNYIF